MPYSTIFEYQREHIGTIVLILDHFRLKKEQFLNLFLSSVKKTDIVAPISTDNLLQKHCFQLSWKI